jgi:cysteine desulfurase family protein (TIGR01976 family)
MTSGRVQRSIGDRKVGLDELAVSELRSEFPALQQTVDDRPVFFFDGPGGSQVHGSVIRAMESYLTKANSNAHGSFLYSRRTDEATYEARIALADFLSASREEEIIFGPNMTTLTFRISQSIGEILSPKDEIVVTRLDHDANVAPWVALQKKGMIVRHVDFSPRDCTLDMASLEKAITARTKVVAVGYASNAVGTVNDVRAIAEMAHDMGAWVYVDAVHYAPHGSIDVAEIDCDFLACSAYKFFGPHLGVLYGRYDLLELLPARKVVPAGKTPPHKFETGTNNFEGIVGAAAAVDYLASVGDRFGGADATEFANFDGRRKLLNAGMAAVRAYEKKLCDKLLEGLGEIPGLRVFGIADRDALDNRVPTVSLTVDDMSPGEVARRLDEQNIYVWDGHFYAVAAIERLGLTNRGGLVRVGLCHYNTLEEVEILLEALSAIRRA